MSEQEKNNTFLLILVIVIAIIIYVGSFGQVDLTIERGGTKQIDDVKNNLNKLQSRHKKLKALIQKKESLNIKLNKKFKRIYFGVRFVLASLFVGYNALLYFVFKITNLGDLLNWNQFALVVMALFSFIAFGTLANVKGFIENIKMRLESRTYHKYVNITEQLEIHKEDEMKLTASITKSKMQINISKQDFFKEAVLIENKDEIV